jgi:hypothetical protein
MLATAFVAGSAHAGVNFVQNPGFETSSGLGPTSFAGLSFGGISAAALWGVWNNSPATTTTALSSPSTDSIAAGGNNMLHITTTGSDNGVFQFFNPHVAHYFSADILDLSGQVQLGSAYGGGNWVTTVINPSPNAAWRHVIVQTAANQNEIFLYSAGGGADFYVDNAYATSSVPELSTWAMMLAGFAGLGFSGYRRAKVRTA